MLAMVKTPATEISPVGIPDVVFLFFTDSLSAGFTPHFPHHLCHAGPSGDIRGITTLQQCDPSCPLGS